MDEVKFIWVYVIYYEYYVLFFLMSRWYMYNVYVIYVLKKSFWVKCIVVIVFVEVFLVN